MKTKFLAALIAAFALSLGLSSAANAQLLGPGPSILDLLDPNIQVDTPSDGSTDQSRQNLDLTFNATVGAGDYSGGDFTFRAGQLGTLIPYIAYSPGGGGAPYTILAVGDQFEVNDASLLDIDITVPFGGSSFSVGPGDTTIYGGIVNPTEDGSQNPVYTNINSGGFMDHDNNADGMLSPAVVGGTVDGLGHANLGRSYAFQISVVPEPSTGILALALLGLAAFKLRRR